MAPQEIKRGIVYLATHPTLNRAVVGYGYHMDPIIRTLTNAKSPYRSTFSASHMIRDTGGVDNWHWTILEDIQYYNKNDLYKTFVKHYKELASAQQLALGGKPVNHELVDWEFVNI